MNIETLDAQDQLIVVEALVHWAHDPDRTDQFCRSDPRRNRALALARNLLQKDELTERDLCELAGEDWPEISTA
jgi:hypothetical protein